MSIRSTPLPAFAKAAARQAGQALESEVYAGADHAEIILRSIHDIPTEVCRNSDVVCDAKFETTAELTNHLRIVPTAIGFEVILSVSAPVQLKALHVAAAENGAASDKKVRRKA